MKIAVLIACHNRREKTLRCLSRLGESRGAVLVREYPDGASSPLNHLQVHLLDDGSSDGTALAVASRFPEVIIYPGDGSHFWNGGMRYLWGQAAATGAEAYLWLNDDVELFPEAILSLVEVLHSRAGGRGIALAACRDASTGLFSYGARERGRAVPPGDSPGRVRTFNGNVVLVSQAAFERVGNLSDRYRHSFGDIEYGLRAQRAGVDCWQIAGFGGTCPAGVAAKWADPQVRFPERVRALFSPKGCPPRELAHFSRQVVGAIWPLVLLKLFFRVTFPKLTARAGDPA